MTGPTPSADFARRVAGAAERTKDATTARIAHRFELTLASLRELEGMGSSPRDAAAVRTLRGIAKPVTKWVNRWLAGEGLIDFDSRRISVEAWLDTAGRARRVRTQDPIQTVTLELFDFRHSFPFPLPAKVVRWRRSSPMGGRWPPGPALSSAR